MAALSAFEITVAPTEDGDAYEAVLFEADSTGKYSDALAVGTGHSALLATKDLLKHLQAPWVVDTVSPFLRPVWKEKP